MIRKYKAFVLWNNPPEGSKDTKIMSLLGEVEGEECFGARENACVKFKLPREKIELEEIPQATTPPPSIVFDKGQRPPPPVTPHLRKRPEPKQATKKRARK